MPLKRRQGENLASASVASLEDPHTMMSASTTLPPMGDEKKKKKKKKLTKAEKTVAKLEKSADTLRRSGGPFDDFMARMDLWLKRNSKRLCTIFRALDPEQEGAVMYEEFKSGIYDTGSPCNQVELHLLCQLLDPNQEEAIHYQELQYGLKHVRDRELTYTKDDYRPVLAPTQRKFEHCPSCKLPIWDGQNYKEPYPRYIELHLRLVTFDGTREHPGHLTLIVHSHLSVQGIMSIIRDKTDLLSTKLTVFRDKTRSHEAMLTPNQTLEGLGFYAGTVDKPEEVTLYYDYVVEFTDCPILMCDHYF